MLEPRLRNNGVVAAPTLADSQIRKRQTNVDVLLLRILDSILEFITLIRDSAVFTERTIICVLYGICVVRHFLFC